MTIAFTLRIAIAVLIGAASAACSRSNPARAG